MEITSRFKTYSVDFVTDLSYIKELVQKEETFFVCDSKVYELYQEELPCVPAERQYLLDSQEENKTIATALAICEKMTGMAAKRNTHLLSVGGGIVQDVTGFVAANLYRGIGWTFYPSTLLAAGDSCIGGKSSLNYHGFKNLLGSFYPPDSIYIYPKFFRTLSMRDYCSGLGETIKFNVIDGVHGLERMESDLEAIMKYDYVKLIQCIRFSLEFKKRFIEEDEFDRGCRILLNYAHTFGHAFETTSNYAIPHGSAVALGMIVANYISAQRGFIRFEYAERIERLCWDILHQVELEDSWFILDQLLPVIRKDKKQTGNQITAVLLQSETSLKVYHDLREEEIEQALRHLLVGKER